MSKIKIEDIEDAVIVEEGKGAAPEPPKGKRKAKASKASEADPKVDVSALETEIAELKHDLAQRDVEISDLTVEREGKLATICRLEDDVQGMAAIIGTKNAEIERLKRELEAANEALKAKPIVRSTRARPFLANQEIENVDF